MYKLRSYFQLHVPIITLMVTLLIHFGKLIHFPLEEETCRVTSGLPFILFACICFTMNLASVCAAAQKDLFFQAWTLQQGQTLSHLDRWTSCSLIALEKWMFSASGKEEPLADYREQSCHEARYVIIRLCSANWSRRQMNLQRLLKVATLRLN